MLFGHVRQYTPSLLDAPPGSTAALFKLTHHPPLTKNKTRTMFLLRSFAGAPRHDPRRCRRSRRHCLDHPVCRDDRRVGARVCCSLRSPSRREPRCPPGAGPIAGVRHHPSFLITPAGVELVDPLPMPVHDALGSYACCLGIFVRSTGPPAPPHGRIGFVGSA